MIQNPTRDKVLELASQGTQDADISAALDLPISNVRYYLRSYSGVANRRQRYTPQLVEGLIFAQAHGTLQEFCNLHFIPLTASYRLIQQHQQAKEFRATLEARGWFNPKATKECYAVGLARNVAHQSLAYLNTLGLQVRIVGNAPYLEHKSGLRARFPLSFEDEIEILANPKKFLQVNSGRVKAGWQVVRRKRHNG